MATLDRQDPEYLYVAMGPREAAAGALAVLAYVSWLRGQGTQADERLAALTERVTERVTSARPARGPGGHGHAPGDTGDTGDTGDDTTDAPAPSGGTAS